jgi:hypothetical protein
MKVPLHTVETIEEDSHSTMMRMRVSGGWLYWISTVSPHNVPSTAMSYCPDPPVVEVHRG